MKKAGIVLLLCSLLGSAAGAATDTTAAQQIDRLENAIYGSVRSGGLISRLDSVEKDLYGTKLQGTLAERESAHVDYLEKGTEGQPSLLYKMSVAEWGLEIFNNADKPLVERIPVVEKRLEGSSMEDKPMAMRVERVLGTVVSDPVTSEPVEVPAGTVVRLQLMETLKPSVTKKGDRVLLKLTHNLIVNNKLVAPVGAPAEGIVTSVKKPRSFGRPSEIRLSVKSLKTLGDPTLPLSEGEASKKATEFEASYAAAAGTSLVGALALGPLGLAGGFFIRGNAKEVPAGAIMYSETEKNVSVPAYPIPASLRALASDKYVDVLSGKIVNLQKVNEEKTKVENAAEPPKKATEIDSL